MNLAETTVSNICIFKPEIGPKLNHTREQFIGKGTQGLLDFLDLS